MDQNNQQILAKDIIQDNNHRMLSDLLIGVYNAKPSKLEVQAMIAKAKLEIHSEQNALFDKLLNTPNAIEKLKVLFNIVSENRTFNSLMNNISSRVSDDYMKQHEKSRFHVTDNDRKALDALIKFIENGGVDWNQSPGSLNAVQNKPEALKADGGNADTVGGYSVDVIRNRQLETLILGTKSDKNDVNAVLNGDSTESFKVITDLEGPYVISLKPGNYYISDIKFNSSNDSRTIAGSGASTKIYVKNELTIGDNMTFKDLTIHGNSSITNIYIKNNCDINNVNFVNCNVIFSNAACSKLRFCALNGSRIAFRDDCNNNMIVFNYFNGMDEVIHIGSNSIIKDNIYC